MQCIVELARLFPFFFIIRTDVCIVSIAKPKGTHIVLSCTLYELLLKAKSNWTKVNQPHNDIYTELLSNGDCSHYQFPVAFFFLLSPIQWKNALRNWEHHLICGCICSCDWVRAHTLNVYYLFRKCKSLIAGVNERENFQNHFHTINTGNCAVHHTTTYSPFDTVTVAVYIYVSAFLDG